MVTFLWLKPKSVQKMARRSTVEAYYVDSVPLRAPLFVENVLGPSLYQGLTLGYR